MNRKAIDLPPTKTERALDALRNGDLKNGIGIIKDFGRYFDKSKLRTLQIAYEMLCGKGNFYKQLGYNEETVIGDAKRILNEKFDLTI